jgi:hypothetical protein
MVVIRTLRSAVLISALLVLCCGCSSGGGVPVTPGNPSNPQYDLSRLAMDEYSSSDECFGIDPRFKGWTESDFSDKYDFDWSTPPDWALPGIGDIEFDRVLIGWVVDPHHKVNTLTLAVTVSLADGEIIDLSNDLTYTGEILPDGGYVYHWECVAPEKLLDSQQHLVQVTVMTLDKTPLMNMGNPRFNPLVLPGIGALYYPWRDVRLPVDQQVLDPMRIKVFIEGDLYPEWAELIKSVDTWTIKGYGNPLSVEFEQLDSDWPIAILNLKEPITMDTDLEFGPVNLEDGLTAYDTEAIIVDGVDREAENWLEPCYCSMTIDEVDHHDYIQAEDFAGCLSIVVHDLGSCSIPCSDVGSLIKTPTCSLNPKDPFNWNENADTCTFGTPVETEWYMRYLRGNDFNTLTYYDGDFMWDYEVSWVFGYIHHNPDILECPVSGLRTVTLYGDFSAVDTTNPQFLEEPRLVYGPEAADWLEEYWHPEDPNFHQGLHQPPSFFRADTCGIYLLIHAQDTLVDGQGVLGAGDLFVDLDIKKTDGSIVFNPYPGVTFGGGIWIDLPPSAGSEYDTGWPDTDHPYENGFPQDTGWAGEERIVVIGMSGIIANPDYAEVKVRVTDYRDNWTRSENLIEDINRSGQTIGVCDYDPEQDYEIDDIFFYQNHKYEDEDCYNEGGNPDRRVACDGYVEMGSGNAVDVIVVTRQMFGEPLPCIPVTISAPNDQPEQSSIEVNLYLISRASPDWTDLRDEVCCANTTSCGDCNNYYGRYADERLFECGLLGDNQPYAIVVSDQTSTSFTEPALYNESPVLYVSNNDSEIADSEVPGQEGLDYKDYAKAIASDSLTNSDNPQIIDSKANIDACFYGFENGDRGEFTPRYTNSFSGCNPGGESQDNFQQNVLSFGQEWIKATADANVENGLSAYFPVQSQADIMFVLSHGGVQNNKSYMCWFSDNPDYQAGDLLLYAEDWDNHLSATGDARWIAATTCYLLNGTETGGAWEDWQDIVQEPLACSLTGIMGFRDLHQTSGYEGMSPEPLFWAEFCLYLDESVTLPQYSSTRWACSLEEYNLVDFAVKCYMEAAYEHYNATFPDWGPIIGPQQIGPAAAVDAGAYYRLNNPDLSPGIYFPIYIERIPHN